LNTAKSLASAHEREVIYVATAEAHDAEMRERIARHRAERPTNWRTLEAPGDLAQALAAIDAGASMEPHASKEAQVSSVRPGAGMAGASKASGASPVIVIDCLTLWLSNALLRDFREHEPAAALPTWAREREAFMRWLEACAHAVILVSNEVGGGIVPASALARRFQSEQGWLNQDVATICERVTLVVAGLPVAIKPR
jgi:adenosylcobinamide kinase/adenosylcobinamide-phosphate guanylyltransferase